MDNPILGELLANWAGLAVCWLGNDGWLIAHGRRLIAFDLDLDSRSRIGPPPLAASDFADHLDAVFISHEHGDHFNAVTAATLARESRCVFVVPANCREKARAIGIPDERVRVARPREPFDLAGVHVEPLRALHGDRHLAVYSGANLDDCGYVLTLSGVRIVQPGDSVLLQDHLALRDIDVLFVSPTIHNMHIQPAATLIQALRPRYVFPQHFDTYRETEDNYFWSHGYPDELLAALDGRMAARYHKLSQGAVFVVEPGTGSKEQC